MSSERTLPLWAGRTAALLGILLVALTLRQAVAAISPILDDIRIDIPISSIGVGLLGAIPPVVFALSGFIVPAVARRIGLDRALVVALLLMIAGHLLRAFAPHFAVLVLGSVVALLGMGFGNVLLPPVVRRYFPDRVGVLTATYACILSFSTAIPSLVAAPLSESVGWRFSLGVWAITAVVAIVPWIVVLANQRRARVADVASLETPPVDLVGRLWRSRVAVSIAVTFSVSTLSTYAGFAWLPEILADIAGVNQAQGGALLALFGFIGAPGAIVAPILVSRLRNVGWVIYFGVAVYVVGYVGLLVSPATATWLWVACLGIGPILFPVCLVLINSRTRTHGGAVALSGFAQGIAYTVGALGPLVVGILHQLTGGWTAPVVFLLCTALAGVVPAITLARPAYVEDELAARTA